MPAGDAVASARAFPSHAISHFHFPVHRLARQDCWRVRGRRPAWQPMPQHVCPLWLLLLLVLGDCRWCCACACARARVRRACRHGVRCASLRSAVASHAANPARHRRRCRPRARPRPRPLHLHTAQRCLSPRPPPTPVWPRAPPGTRYCGHTLRRLSATCGTGTRHCAASLPRDTPAAGVP